MVQGSRHNIPKILHRRCAHFQNSAAAGRAELPVENCAATVIRFVDRGLFGLRGIGEGGDWDFGCQSECRTEEFLSRF